MVSGIPAFIAIGEWISHSRDCCHSAAVTIKKHTRLPEAPVSVSYDRIANIEREGGGMGWGKAIGMGVGAGAAAILTIFLIALQLD